MKFRIVLPMVLLLIASFAIVSGLDAQTKSDLPAGWDEPTELPAGAVRLEDVDRGVGPSPAPAAPTTPSAAAPTMPTSPTPPPMPNQPASPRPAAVMPTSPAMAGSGEPTTGGDTRNLPVDMRFAPPEAGGMSPYTPPPPPSGRTAAAPISSPPPPPPPVSTSTPGASAGYSDLPAGWDEETALPAGAVRLEDINSPYGGMTDRGAVASPSSTPPAAAPMAPAYQPPAAPVQPAYQPPMPESAAPRVKKNDYQAPSRWKNK
jgi:hypothetical protein